MDGLTAVVTTGIYCRSGCGARPKPENVRRFGARKVSEKRWSLNRELSGFTPSGRVMVTAARLAKASTSSTSGEESVRP